MTYRVYLTTELPVEYDSLEAAQAAAIEMLRAAPRSTIQARVFQEGRVLSGEHHEFVVDIFDGCM